MTLIDYSIKFLIGLMMALTVIITGSLAWANTPDVNESVYSLSIRDIEEDVAQQLVKEGAGNIIEVSLVGRHAPQYHQASKPVSFSISFLDYNARTMRWDADIEIFEGDTMAKSVKMSGRYKPMIDVPVLNKRLFKNDIIEGSDIAWERVAEHRLRKSILFDIDEIVGKSPRRTIPESRPINAEDLMEPIVTKKGDMVHVLFTTPYMEIRTVGESLEDVSIGEVFSLRNTKSHINLRAKLIAPGVAQVQDMIQLSQYQ